MVSLNDILFQILQPYFFYSLVFLSITFLFIKIFLKFNPIQSKRIQAFIWLIPLLIPVAVLWRFQPQTVISISQSMPQISVPTGMSIALAGSTFLSFTGILCISGVIAATGYFLFTIFLGPKVALKHFHVVMMTHDEHVSLQDKIGEIAQKLNISKPQVGLIDDLLPNAFTVGYGKNTVIVFSLGLLNIFNLEELTAVAAHELAHVKAKDYLFKSATYALNLLSFFNPLSYFATSQCQKERELLADEKGAALLGKPDLMAEVLTKVTNIAQEFPKANLADRLSSRLFLVSPLAHKLGILASHPQVSQRIQNINSVKSTPIKKSRLIATVLLLGFMLSIALMAGYSTVQAQNTFSQKATNILINGQSFYLYNNTFVFDSAHPTGILFANASDLQLFMTSLTQNNNHTGYYLDGNGRVHTYTSATPNTIIINLESVAINGQSPFIGNGTYPLDLTHITGFIVINEDSMPSSP